MSDTTVLSDEDKEWVKAFARAVKTADVPAIKDIAAKFPKIVETYVLEPWMCLAASKGDVPTISALYELGCDPNLTGIGGADARNALAIAASKGDLASVTYLHQNGTAFDTSRPTKHALIAAIPSRSAPVAQYLLNAGIDATVDYEVAPGVRYNATAYALEQGAREVASLIALHLTDQDRAAAQAELDRAWAAVVAGNPNANAADVPSPPKLDPPFA